MKRILLVIIAFFLSANASDLARNGTFSRSSSTLSEMVKSSNFGRFKRDEKKQIVTDGTSRLQWQDDTNGTIANSGGKKWSDALKHCEKLTLGGYSDWRLPSIDELSSIVDKSRKKPAIDTISFRNGTPQYYWSSTTSKNKKYAKVVNFYDGNIYNNFKDYKNFIRCVRKMK